MNVAFDGNVPLPLRQFLPGHNVVTLQELGWAGIGNGELIRRLDGRCDALVLADKNLRYQQNLLGRRLALIELPTNRWPLLQGIVSRVANAVAQATPGSYTIIEL